MGPAPKDTLEEAMEGSFRLTNVTACTPHGLIEQATIVVEGGRIAFVGHGAPRCASGDRLREIDGGGKYALPGFIDIHCHGAGLFELVSGMFNAETGAFDASDESFEQGLDQYVRLKAREGVSNFYIATCAAHPDQLRNAFARLAHFMGNGRNGTHGPFVQGALLEGTFFNPRMAGAQDPRYAFEPARHLFDELNESGVIKLVNVAPEYGKPAYELIEHVITKGVVPGTGHTDATGNQIAEGVRHGLRYIIHFTNGPTGGSYKPFEGGGTIEATLRTDALYAELICDGYHVSPEYMRDIIARKGPDKIISVTDQMFVAGTNVRMFRLGQVEGEVAPDGSHIRVVGKKNTLFGSCLTMDVGFSNLLSLLTRDMAGVWHRHHAAMPPQEALLATSAMCSTNPARLTGLLNDPICPTGSLEPGKIADIVLGRLEGEPGRYRFSVERLFVRGRSISVESPA